MRLAGVIIVLTTWFGIAHADDKALKPYAGRIIISPDLPPSVVSELPAYLKINATTDNSYDLFKGPPWPLHLVAILSKDVGTKRVTLAFADKADKKLTAIHSIELASKRKIVIAHSEATIAAGFAAGKTYVVRVMLGKTVLAKAELTLRE